MKKILVLHEELGYSEYSNLNLYNIDDKVEFLDVYQDAVNVDWHPQSTSEVLSLDIDEIWLTDPFSGDLWKAPYDFNLKNYLKSYFN